MQRMWSKFAAAHDLKYSHDEEARREEGKYNQEYLNISVNFLRTTVAIVIKYLCWTTI